MPPPHPGILTARGRGDYDDNPRYCADIDFMAAHWTEVPGQPGYSSCDQFDPQARLCLAQEGKPPICRDYPWYHFEPASIARNLLPECSFLLDVPPAARPEGARPLIPIEVLGRRPHGPHTSGA